MKTRINSVKQSYLKSLGLFGLCMMFSLFANQAFAQQRTVSGQVTSIDGPVEAASVVLKGSSEFAQTDEEGKFVFPRELYANDVLVISSLGYETLEVVIDEETNYVEPYLKDVTVVIIAALRTEPSKAEDPN